MSNPNSKTNNNIHKTTNPTKKDGQTYNDGYDSLYESDEKNKTYSGKVYRKEVPPEKDKGPDLKTDHKTNVDKTSEKFKETNSVPKPKKK